MKIDKNEKEIVIEFEKEDEDKKVKIITPKDIGCCFMSRNSMYVNIKSKTATEEEEIYKSFKKVNATFP